MRRTMTTLAIAVVGLFFAADAADAQITPGAYNNSTYNYQTPSSIFLDNTIRRPTVSPYLNLLQPSGQLGTNYHTLVRPALEHQKEQQNQQRLNQMQQQFNQAVVSSGAQRQRTEGIRPTGHVATYMNYLHYYRMPGQPR